MPTSKGQQFCVTSNTHLCNINLLPNTLSKGVQVLGCNRVFQHAVLLPTLPAGSVRGKTACKQPRSGSFVAHYSPNLAAQIFVKKTHREQTGKRPFGGFPSPAENRGGTACLEAMFRARPRVGKCLQHP